MQEISLAHEQKPLDIRRRRLLYRASYRGIKEMDIILGGYVAAHIAAMDESELDALECILAFEDRDLFQWMLDECPPPKAVLSPLFKKILDYRSCIPMLLSANVSV